MGYRCPDCGKDYDNNRKEFLKHLARKCAPKYLPVGVTQKQFNRAEYLGDLVAHDLCNFLATEKIELKASKTSTFEACSDIVKFVIIVSQQAEKLLSKQQETEATND